jgi:hypothetical protein
MLHLDLSHNKLTGDLDVFKHQQDFNYSSLSDLLLNQSFNKSLTLSVNRLSGDLPSSFGQYADLEILSGNLFGCDGLPKNDKESESLSCGSQQYDQSMALMGGVLGMMLCLFAIYRLLCLFASQSQDDRSKMDWFLFLMRVVGSRTVPGYVKYSDQLNLHSREAKDLASHPLQSINSFWSLLYHLIWSVCVFTFLSLILTLPVYLLKYLDVESINEGGDTQYVTHTHMYNWLWTMAFVSGTTPAIILMVTVFLILSYFHVIINHLGDNGNPSSSALLPASPKALLDDQSHFLGFTVWLILFLNIIVVGTVNGLYIWSTLLDLARNLRIWIQLSFALFSSLWGVVLRRGLPSRVKDSSYGVWLFICLNVINSVMIPCAVTALSTPSCYQVSKYKRLLHFDIS